MFYLTGHRFHFLRKCPYRILELIFRNRNRNRFQSPTFTTYGKYLRESRMAVLTPKSGIKTKWNQWKSSWIFFRFFIIWGADDCTERISIKVGIRYCRSNPGISSGRFLFLIFIDYMSNGFSSNAKLFADNTTWLSVKHDINRAANELNDGLTKINSLAYQWKMSFNPDPSKQA